jgi:hypothetical protein
MDNTLTIQDKLQHSPLKTAVILKTGADGLTTSTVIFRRERTRRVSKRWKSVDKLIRRLSQAQQATANEFAARHERSNAKKKNGGMRDLVKNLSKSSRKGRKKLKIRFL